MRCYALDDLAGVAIFFAYVAVLPFSRFNLVAHLSTYLGIYTVLPSTKLRQPSLHLGDEMALFLRWSLKSGLHVAFIAVPRTPQANPAASPSL